jgi:hypothetical protein
MKFSYFPLFYFFSGFETGGLKKSSLEAQFEKALVIHFLCLNLIYSKTIISSQLSLVKTRIILDFPSES